MKKNIFKKIVASLATVAMAVGMFAAMPAEEAKAAEPVGVSQENPISVTFHFKKPAEWGAVYVKACVGNWEYPSDDTVGNYKGYTGAGVETALLEEDADNKGWYTVTVKTGKAWGINLIFANTKWEGQTKNIQLAYSMPAGEYEFWYTMDDESIITDGCRLGLSEYKSLYADTEKPYVAMDSLAKAPTGWVKAADSAVAAKAEAAIDEAIAVAATKANKAKYDKASTAYNGLTDAQKALVNSAKVTKLNAGVKAINDILEAEQAAEDAKYAGKITVYVKNPGWDKVLLYAWDRTGTPLFGSYPGSELTALKQNKGWYSCSFNTTKSTSILFGNGKEGGGDNQSADWNGVKAGTYWITFTDKNDEGKYAIADANIATSAPSGWKDEKAQEVTTVAPTTTPAPTTTKPAVDKGSVASKADVEKIDKEAVVEGAPADAKLDATEIAADSDAFKVVKEAAKTAFKNKTYVALDLKLVKGSEVVQANGDVKVTIPVPTALAKSTKVAVYRVGDDNKLVSCGTADVANGKITFTTNHFSTYVFADASVSANKPGDAAPIVLMLAVAAVAAGMVVASKKKTICE